MKQFIFILIIGIMACMSCENEAQKQSKKAVSDLSAYVDSIQTASPEYTSSYWNNIEAGYENKAAKAEALAANLNEGLKEELNKTKVEFNEFKDRFKNEKRTYEEKLKEEKKARLRSDLFGENKVKDQTNLVWITSKNIAEIYKNFVEGVSNNKKNYSEEDWNYIREIFKSLNDRRDEISKEISGKDKLKITEQKVRFEAIRATN